MVDGYPGLQRDLLTYLRERIKEVLTGASATIVVRVFGSDLDVLQRKAAEVGKAIGSVRGAVDVKVQALTLVPQVEVAFDRDRAQQVGVTPAVVRDTVATMLRGVKVGEVFDAQKIFDVVVWGAPDVRSDVFALRRMPIELPAGGYTPLAAVADVRVTPTPNEITREGGSRRIDITCNVRDRDLGTVARDIASALRGVTFDPGYHPEVLGEYAARAASQRRLLALGVVSLVSILLVLHVDFGSVRMVGAHRFDDSLCADWWRRQRVSHWGRVVAGIARGIRHGPWHRRAQWHHADQPLSTPRRRGACAVRP